MGVYISGISKETFATLVGRALFEGLEPNLIEVKTPHGRLIDVDKHDYPGDLIYDETVIEAEEK